jgi:hypothetical protein
MEEAVEMGLLKRFFRRIICVHTNTTFRRFKIMPPFQPDFTALNAAAQALIDAAVAAAPAPAPVSGVSSDQEAADIASAVAAAQKPLQDQIAALQVDDQAKADLATSLQGTVDKIKALLA